MIRRRKAADKVFAVVGLLSVVVGLATLAALLMSLWKDAEKRLWVPQGTVAITENQLKAPDGRNLYPEEQATEIRKISGDALMDLVDGADPSEVLNLTEIIDVNRLEQLTLSGELAAIVKSGDLNSLVRSEHVRELLDENRTAELAELSRYMPPNRSQRIREQHSGADFIRADTLKRMVEEKQLGGLLHTRKLEDALDPEWGDLKPWIAKGELSRRLAKLVRPELLAELVDQDKLAAFAKREYLVAQAQPREFNSSFFITLKPSAFPETTGILIAWVDSLIIIAVTMLAALPVGVGAGVYLEEYAPKNKLTALIEINIANLAGVPSIIYGLMALGIFVYQLGTGRSILTAGLTLSLLVLPIVILSTREAIRAIPQHIREASYGCGATKWQTVQHHILPYSAGGILTGSIIGLSRAIGETAPLITIGALTFVTTLPWDGSSSPVDWLHAGFTALPLLMYNLISKPQPEFHQSAALAGIVLIGLTLSLNAVAIYLRYRLRKSLKW